MAADENPVKHCTVDAPLDLQASLADLGVDHLSIDAGRTIVIYQSAILLLVATEGEIDAARGFDVELWEPPIESRDRRPEELLSTFLERLDATKRSRQTG